jgi:formylglycine-generating enzyme required for sulfatase activity
VKITKPFYMAVYPVTQGEYEKVMGSNPSAFTEKQVDASTFKPPLLEKRLRHRVDDRKKVVGKDTSRHPVETVNWDEAMEFCRRLSALPAERSARRTYRLPTEAEWEYACRAGTTTRWCCGDDEAGLLEYGWFTQNAGGMTHPVGRKKPNAWNLYDMQGNVYQWCSDWFSLDYYKQSPPSDPTGPPASPGRVMRGGSWYDIASSCRSAYRVYNEPAYCDHNRGFRIVVEVAPPAESGAPQAAGQRPTQTSPTKTPPLAKPSMPALEAAQVQRQWAEHLYLPAEETNSIGMKLALIPPGEFDMGSTPEEVQWALEYVKQNKIINKYYLERVPGEAPRHRVKITKPFYMAVFPVTQGEYEKVVGVNPSAFTEKQMDASSFKPPLWETEVTMRRDDRPTIRGKDTSRHPVETVNWEEAMEFCRKLSALPAERAARRTYRLPTEAEWEYACRAGTTTRWFCGDDEAGLQEYGWDTKNAGGMTHPVGEKKPNAWGLYDMHGNVWQWCSDWFSLDYYQQSPPSDPLGPTACSSRVLRGGNWDDSPFSCRSAFRLSRGPASRLHGVGFRVVVGR